MLIANEEVLKQCGMHVLDRTADKRTMLFQHPR